MPDTVISAERNNNHLTSTSWCDYSEHRRVVTKLVLEAGKQATSNDNSSELPRLCVLGAGNINDLDLEKLIPSFSKISLLDIDPRAVHRGVSRQKQALTIKQKEWFDNQIEIVGPIDVSGVAEILQPSAHKEFPTEQLQELASKTISQLAQQAPLSNSLTIGRFDVVVSACLLSQLIRQVNEAFGEGSQASKNLRQQSIVNHLQLLIALTTPGGQALLITDLASSSKSVPELTGVPSKLEINEVANRVLREGSYFQDMAPKDLLGILESIEIQPYIASTETSDFWQWMLSSREHLLCYALVIKRIIEIQDAESADASNRLANRLRAFSTKTGISIRSTYQS